MIQKLLIKEIKKKKEKEINKKDKKAFEFQYVFINFLYRIELPRPTQTRYTEF